MINRIIKSKAFKKKRGGGGKYMKMKGKNIKRSSLGSREFGDVLGLGTDRKDMGDPKWSCDVGSN